MIIWYSLVSLMILGGISVVFSQSGSTIRYVRSSVVSDWGITALTPIDEGRLLVVGDQAGNITILNTVDLTPISGYQANIGSPVKDIIELNEKSLLCVDHRGRQAVYSVTDRGLDPDGGPLGDPLLEKIVVSPSGFSAVKIFHNEIILYYDTNELALPSLHRPRIRLTEKIKDLLMISGEINGLVGIGHQKLLIWEWDYEHQRLSSNADIIPLSVDPMLFSSNSLGNLFIMGTSGGALMFFDVKNRELFSQESLFGDISVITFTPNDSVVIVGTSTGAIHCYAIRDNRSIPLARYSRHNDRITQIRFVHNKMFTSGLDRQLICWEIALSDPLSTRRVMPWENIRGNIPDSLVVLFDEPSFNESNSFTCYRRDRVTLTGEVRSNCPIRYLQIRERRVHLNENNRFFLDHPLTIGLNRFRVRAENIRGTRYDDIFFIHNKDEEIDRTPPILTILDPTFPPNNVIETDRRRIAFKGKVKDNNQVVLFQIGDRTINVGREGGDFEIDIPLERGLNTIKFRARDSNNNDTTYIYYVEAQIRPDYVGPQIVIYEPPLDPVVNRGLRIRELRKEIKISGNIKDEDGVREAFVSLYGETEDSRTQIEIPIDSKGDFTLSVPLRRGDNKVIIDACDRLGNWETRLLAIFVRDTRDTMTIGDYYALLMGADEYNYDSSGWLPLRYPVNDCRKLYQILREKYSFSRIDTLFNETMTRENIIRYLENMSRELGENDNLLIYYAGHGYKDFDGYWVPIDARKGTTSNYIPYADIRRWLSRGINRARHILLIADNCYAGLFTQNARINSGRPPEGISEWWLKYYSLPSRRAILSGLDEIVPDSSVFSEALCQYLKSNNSQYISAQDIYNSIYKYVAENAGCMPIYEPISEGDEGGQFIFKLREGQ